LRLEGRRGVSKLREAASGGGDVGAIITRDDMTEEREEKVRMTWALMTKSIRLSVATLRSHHQ